MTSVTRHGLGALAALAIASVPGGGRAEGVVLYREVPSACAIAGVLFPDRIGADPDCARPAAGTEPPSRGLRLEVRPGDDAAATAPPPTPGVAPEADGVGFTIAFGFDSTAIAPDSRPYLDRMAEALRLTAARDAGVVIVGHTDASGPAAYNEGLSLRRADAVRSYLIGRSGVEGGRLRVAGAGESRPLAGVAPDDPLNRRVEFRSTR